MRSSAVNLVVLSWSLLGLAACSSPSAGAAPQASTPTYAAVVEQPSERIARGDAFSDDFDCWGYVEKDGAIFIRQSAMQSVQTHAVPIDIEYEVMTDSTDIRLGYGADQIIFNWAGCPNELRIDGAPAGTRNIHGMGWVPPNKFVKIRQIVTDDSMTLLVDGVERASWKSDFTGYRGRIKLFTAGDARLGVRAIRFAKPQG